MRDKVRSDLAREGIDLARRATVVQSVVTVLVIALGFAIGGYQQGISAGMGGLISLLPNTIFAFFAFRYAGAQQNQLVARSFSQGAKVKLAVSIILFVIAFKGVNASPLALFAGFAVTTVSYWLTLLLQHKQR